MCFTKYQDEKKENFKILLKDFLTDFSRRFNPLWICLNEKCDNYRLDKLFQNTDVIKYKTEIESIKFILSASNDKFNLEIVYPDNEDFIYQVPFIEGNDFQELLREIYNEITELDFCAMDDFYSFLKKF